MTQIFLKEDRGIFNCTLWNTIFKNIIKVAAVIKKKWRNELYLLKDFYHYIN